MIGKGGKKRLEIVERLPSLFRQLNRARAQSRVCVCVSTTFILLLLQAACLLYIDIDINVCVCVCVCLVLLDFLNCNTTSVVFRHENEKRSLIIV